MAKEFGKAAFSLGKTVVKHPAVRQAASTLGPILLNAAKEQIELRLRRFNESAAAGESVPTSVAIVLDEDPGLATLGEVQAHIFEVGRLNVVFVHRKTGRDIRDDRRGFFPYSYVNKMNDEMTVSDLIRGRLSAYETKEIKATVKCAGERDPAHGGTKLKVVRATYID